MWKCNKCGETNDDNYSQCKKCGSKRSAQPAEPRHRHAPISNPASDAVSAPPETVPATPPCDDTDPAKKLKSKESAVEASKILILSATLLQLVLFSLVYAKTPDYTIYKACSGEYGSIEQICSILLVVLTFVPAITVLIKLDLRKRNLPVTTSVIVASLTTVYCLVILFGSDDSTAVPALIILLSWGIVFLAYKYVKALNEVDNTLLFRPTSF